MQGWALTIAYCPPLRYLVDFFNAAMSGTSARSPLVDGGVLIVVCTGCILAARVIRKRNMMKRMKENEKKTVRNRGILFTCSF